MMIDLSVKVTIISVSNVKDIQFTIKMISIVRMHYV